MARPPTALNYKGKNGLTANRRSKSEADKSIESSATAALIVYFKACIGPMQSGFSLLLA